MPVPTPRCVVVDGMDAVDLRGDGVAVVRVDGHVVGARAIHVSAGSAAAGMDREHARQTLGRRIMALHAKGVDDRRLWSMLRRLACLASGPDDVAVLVTVAGRRWASAAQAALQAVENIGISPGRAILEPHAHALTRIYVDALPEWDQAPERSAWLMAAWTAMVLSGGGGPPPPRRVAQYACIFTASEAAAWARHAGRSLWPGYARALHQAAQVCQGDPET